VCPSSALRIAARCPIADMPPDLREWRSERRLESVADACVPWYFNLFLSSADCREKLTVTYEKLIVDPLAQVRRVCDYAGLHCSEQEMAAATQEAFAASIKTKNKTAPGRARVGSPAARAGADRSARRRLSEL
jgi:hypothetical protein